MRLNRDKNSKSAERKVVPTSEFERQLKQLLNEEKNGGLDGANNRIYTNGSPKNNLNGNNNTGSPTNLSPQMSVSSTNSTTPREDIDRDQPSESLIETENFYLCEQNRHLKRELMHSKLNIDAMKKVANSKEVIVVNLTRDKEKLETRVKHLEKVLNWFRDNASQNLLEGCPFMPGHGSSPSLVSLSTTESESRMENIQNIHLSIKPNDSTKARRKSENFQFVKDFFKFSTRNSASVKTKKDKNVDKSAEDWITCDDDLDASGLTESQMIGILPMNTNDEDQPKQQTFNSNSLREPSSPTTNPPNPFNSLPSRNSFSKESGERDRSELINHLFSRPSPSSSQTSLPLPTATPPNSGNTPIEITEPEPDQDLPDIEAELANLTLQDLDLDLENDEIDSSLEASFEGGEIKSSIVEENSDEEGDVVEVKQRLVVTNHSPNDDSSLETSNLSDGRVSIDEGVQVIDQVTRMSFYPVEVVDSDASSEHKIHSATQPRPPTPDSTLKVNISPESTIRSPAGTPNLSVSSKLSALPPLPGLSPTKLSTLVNSTTHRDVHNLARSPTSPTSELPLPPTPTVDPPPLPFKSELDRRHTLNNRLSLPPIRHEHKFEDLDDDEPLSTVVKRSHSRDKVPLSVVINPTGTDNFTQANGNEPLSKMTNKKDIPKSPSISATLSHKPNSNASSPSHELHTKDNNSSNMGSGMQVSVESPKRPDRPLPPIPNLFNQPATPNLNGVVHLNIKKNTPVRRRSSRRSNKVNTNLTSANTTEIHPQTSP